MSRGVLICTEKDGAQTFSTVTSSISGAQKQWVLSTLYYFTHSKTFSEKKVYPSNILRVLHLSLKHSPTSRSPFHWRHFLPAAHLRDHTPPRLYLDRPCRHSLRQQDHQFHCHLLIFSCVLLWILKKLYKKEYLISWVILMLFLSNNCNYGKKKCKNTCKCLKDVNRTIYIHRYNAPTWEACG